MTDRDMASEGVERRLVEDLGDQTHVFIDHDLRAIPHGDASGLLTAVLQRVKPEIGELGHLFPRGPHPEDTAGVSRPFLAGKKIVTEPSVWAWHAGKSTRQAGAGGPNSAPQARRVGRATVRPMSVIDWLLDGDPAIRWQVLRDLKKAAPNDVAAERARVEHDGWGARLLGLEGLDGLWDGGAYVPASYTGDEPGQPWTATMHTLQTLQIFGLDPASESARRAIALVAENGRWEHEGQRYFDGEVEPCINGRTIESGAYFGVDVAAIVERILSERLGDGGWNCQVEYGSVRSSFDTTINVLDGLLEFERATGGSAEVSAARRSGEDYLLDRGLFRRKTTGEVADPAYLDFAFPYYWHYDLLRALDYFRRSGADLDPRMAEAVEVVRSKQQSDGRWLLDRIHPGRVYFDVEGGEGTPSRWNTLRALRVLDWWDVAA
jgi:hypothetical protein